MTNIRGNKIIIPEENEMKDKGFFGGVYGLAFIGALVYYIQHSTSFLNGVVGILKALFWPAVLMFKVLELLHM